MQVCFGCQHTFPSGTLDYVDVSTELAERLSSIRTHMARVQPSTGSGRQAVAAMEEGLNTILAVIRKELDDKNQKIKKLESQLAYINKENEDFRRRHLGLGGALPAGLPPAAVTIPQKPKSARGGSYSMNSVAGAQLGQTLDRFLVSATAAPPPVTSLSGRQSASVGPNGSVGPAVIAMRTTTALPPTNNGARPSELVSAAIYCVLEALVVKCRAEIGVLWLRPQDSAGELLAPFIAGHHKTSLLRSSAPYRIPSSSLVGTVASTGISVNLSPSPDAASPDSAQSPATGRAGSSHASGAPGTAKPSFAQFLEVNRFANLLIPIYSRYGEATRETIGIIHLVGSTEKPFPFGERNEQDAVHAARLLSHIITSHISNMLPEWTTRMYDSSPMSSVAAYNALLDQRPAEKGEDDFDMTPTLMFRCENNERATPTNLAQTKVLRNDAKQYAVPLPTAATSLRDVHRYLKSVEENWTQAVNLQTSLERKVEQLSSQLDAARQGLHSLSKGTDYASFRHKGTPLTIQDSAVASPTWSTHTADTANRLASPPASVSSTTGTHKPQLTTVDVEDVEHDVAARIRKSQHAVFLTETGDISTPNKRRHQHVTTGPTPHSSKK